MIDVTQVWSRLDALAKPPRSLGRLEALAVRLATIQQTLTPKTRPRRLVLFAGDHGVVARGVSAWPSEVTGLMVRTMLSGRATSTAFACAHDCDVRLVDVGVASAPPRDPPAHYRNARVAPGTADLSSGPAMTLEQFDAAWNVGASEAALAVEQGYVLLLAGEMGIGNTTPAACLTMLLADETVDRAVGRGAGADDETLQRKRAVVSAAVERVRSGVDRARQRVDTTDLRRTLAEVCGFEIAAMAGFYAEAARLRATLLLDGYVATAAALLAESLRPGTATRMIAAHRSAEPGHEAALNRLALEPVLDWGMRLGEGTGALVALPLLDSATTLLTDVAALSEVVPAQA